MAEPNFAVEVPFVSAALKSLVGLLRALALMTGLLVPASGVWAQYQQPGGLRSSAASTPVRVSGRVVNAVNGAPVSRALVRLNNRALLTDQEGKFQFEQVTGNAANFVVQKPGYFATADPFEAPNAYYQLDQLDGPIELKLYPEALLTGTVIGPDGDPLNRVNVQARRSLVNETGRQWTTTGQAQTNERGEFRITVPAGDYRLETPYLPRGNGGAGLGREAVLPLSLPAATSGGAPQVIHLHHGEEQRFDLRPAVRRTYPVGLKLEGVPDRNFPQITARSTSGPSFRLGVVPSRNGGGATLFLPTGSYRLSARLQTAEGIETAESSVTVTGSEKDVADGAGAADGVVLRFVATAAIPVEVAVDSAASTTPTNGNFASIGLGRIGSSNSTPTALQLGLVLVPAANDGTTDDEAGQSYTMTQPRNGTPGFQVPPGNYRLLAGGYSQWFIESATAGATDLLTQGLSVAAGSANAPIRLVVDNRTGSLESNVLLKGKVPATCWVYLIPTPPSATPIRSLRCASTGVLTTPYLPPGGYQAIAFEHRVGADLSVPANLLPFGGYVQTLTITAGNKATVKLNAVPEAESMR